MLAFLTLPGTVAGLIPAILLFGERFDNQDWAFGLIFGGAGWLLLLWCVRDFFVAGKGTLAPWDPPKRLVVVGLYRLVRNPMYLSVLLLLVGWMLASGARVLIWYGLLVAVGFHLRVIWHEEPWLKRQFGADWIAYAATTGRWLPRWRSRKR